MQVIEIFNAPPPEASRLAGAPPSYMLAPAPAYLARDAAIVAAKAAEFHAAIAAGAAPRESLELAQLRLTDNERRRASRRATREIFGRAAAVIAPRDDLAS